MFLAIYLQIIYKTQVISYSIIPFLTLITSSLIVISNIIGRLYNSIITRWQDKSADNLGFEENDEGESLIKEDMEINLAKKII